MGRLLYWGGSLAQIKGAYTRAVLDASGRESMILILSTPFCDLSPEVQDIIIHGTNGHEVKVHYKGKRGEGVYDVAFEGLIRNVQRRYRENRILNVREQNMKTL